jgi:hypothetical protein
MPAKRADVVQRAVNLIGPKPEDRDACEIEIKDAVDYIATERRDLPFIQRRTSAAGKKAARRLERALDNLYAALTHHELPDDLGLRIPRDRRQRQYATYDTSFLTRAEAGEWLTEWMDRVYSMQKRKPLDFKIESELKLIAANEANALMERFNSSKRFPWKKFCELAALLYGDPDVNLVFACRKVRSASL